MRRLGSLWLPGAPNIWRHGRTLEPKQAFEFNLGLRGFFTVELIDARTQKVKRRLEFPNLITNAGLNNAWSTAGNLANQFVWAAVGTDSTAPAVTDTSLGAEISPSSTHRTNSNGGFVDVVTHVGASFYWKTAKTYLFLEAQGNGNLTEIGIFTAQTAGTMWTRQLFKDGGGVPTTIVKTSSDQLRVTYEMRVYYPSADLVSTFDLSGATWDYTSRVNDVDNSGSWGSVLSVFQGPAWHGSGGFGPPGVHESNALVATTTDKGSGTGSSSTSIGSYTSGNFYRDGAAIWEPGIANFGTGIGAWIAVWGGFQNNPRLFQISFHAAQILKTNTKRLTLNARMSLARL